MNNGEAGAWRVTATVASGQGLYCLAPALLEDPGQGAVATESQVMAPVTPGTPGHPRQDSLGRSTHGDAAAPARTVTWMLGQAKAFIVLSTC